MKQKSIEPEKRHYNRDYGYNDELEWIFNAAASELGMHGCAWREFVSASEPNTESSDLVVGWGKCLVSVPEKYRRVMRAFALMTPSSLDVLAARYSPITAHSVQEDGRNEAAWNVQLTAELKWVAIVVAKEADRAELAACREPKHLASLLKDIDAGTANKSKQKGHKSWLHKAEQASREAHAMYDRARDFGRRPGWNHHWVITGEFPKRGTTPADRAVMPYSELLELWRTEMAKPEPERPHKPTRPPRARPSRKQTTIEIQRGVEWASA